jgi:hypothetical protein
VLISFPNEEGVMSCEVGDIISIIDMLPSGWGYGRVQQKETQIEGYFPSNYCTSIVKSQDEIEKLIGNIHFILFFFLSPSS